MIKMRSPKLFNYWDNAFKFAKDLKKEGVLYISPKVGELELWFFEMDGIFQTYSLREAIDNQLDTTFCSREWVEKWADHLETLAKELREEAAHERQGPDGDRLGVPDRR